MTAQRWCLAGALVLAAIAMAVVVIPTIAQTCHWDLFDGVCEPDDWFCDDSDDGDIWCTDGGGATGGGGDSGLSTIQARNLARGKHKAAEAFDNPPNPNVDCPTAFGIIRSLPGGSNMDNRNPRQLIYTATYRNGIGNPNHCRNDTTIAAAEVGGNTIFLCRGFNVSLEDEDSATILLHEVAHLMGWDHPPGDSPESTLGTMVIGQHCFAD